MTFRRVGSALLLTNFLTACTLPSHTDAARSTPRPDSEHRYTVRAVSADGKTVVGDVTDAGNTWTHAFRWTEAGGPQDLGTFGPPYVYSTAAGVSADGSRLMGYSDTTTDRDYRRFVWTEAGGMKDAGPTDSSAE